MCKNSNSKTIFKTEPKGVLYLTGDVIKNDNGVGYRRQGSDRPSAVFFRIE